MVLGSMATMDSGRIPSEQRFEKLKHSRGSGVLSVEVLAAGPTRLLRITDENERVHVLINQPIPIYIHVHKGTIHVHVLN